MPALLDLSMALQSPLLLLEILSGVMQTSPCVQSGEAMDLTVLEGKLAILLKLIISKVHRPFAPALLLLEKSLQILSLLK